MEEPPHASRLAAWVRSVGILAASAPQQAKWLDSLGLVASWNVSELAMEFDDGLLLMPQWVSAGWVSEQSVASLKALDSALNDMSGEGNAALWTRDALAKHSAWEGVRSLATDALCSFR